MAKYAFQCDECKYTIELFASPKTLKGICSQCNGPTSRLLPTMNGPATTYENADHQSGVKRINEHSAIISQRKLRYYYEVEVPRFVASGVYSVETMLENDWIWLDDHGQIHVNTKPKSQR